MNTNRRQFINQLGLATAGLSLASMDSLMARNTAAKFTFDISLAEFSFASELYGGKMTNMDFPARAKNDYDISILEYVSGFFNNKHTDQTYLSELKKRCDDLGMKNHLIMVDGENLTALAAAARQKAVESHYPWVDAAKFLGCTAIRVNLGDAMAMLSGKKEEGTPEQLATAAVDGYGKLLEYAGKAGMNVIVENHFGVSTDPDWLVGVMKQLPAKNKGLLPDFGNFCAERSKPATMDLKGIMATTCVKEHDRYEGVKKMMPYARGISAKTHRFDDKGNDPETDFIKIFNIIKASGWTGGIVGIEYEGGLMRDMGGDMTKPTNDEGIRQTKALLEKVLEELG
ncbi:sugar phosphate isomerase/epimerase family protein [Dyadobacter pollutisoli]|uniref:TIM barrel protein n=1 Tax=Dyadobacter pollutisoli TaxID=2910158 RepID=A0A9E8SMD0_9BACT|nr:TIM barrel protein [Dyadobacter pollutisoli]WAC13998.1 TIM barrel protein [Dyadobacter pollutisoli]